MAIRFALFRSAPTPRYRHDADVEAAQPSCQRSADRAEPHDRHGLPQERRSHRGADSTLAQIFLRSRPAPSQREHEQDRKLGDGIGVGRFTARDVGDVDAVARGGVYIHPIEPGAELLNEAQARRGESLLPHGRDERDEHFDTLGQVGDLFRRAFENLVLGKRGAKQFDDLGRASAAEADFHAD